MIAIDKIAAAIEQGFKFFAQRAASRDKRRMQKALEGGEQYIFVDEKAGQYSKLTPSELKKQKARFRKQFFKYNS